MGVYNFNWKLLIITIWITGVYNSDGKGSTARSVEMLLDEEVVMPG